MGVCILTHAKVEISEGDSRENEDVFDCVGVIKEEINRSKCQVFLCVFLRFCLLSFSDGGVAFTVAAFLISSGVYVRTLYNSVVVVVVVVVALMCCFLGNFLGSHWGAPLAPHTSQFVPVRRAA